MCLAIPMRIVKIEGSLGTVDAGGNQISADLTFVPSASVGDYVIVHAGFAMKVMDEEEAQETLEMISEMLDKADSEPLTAKE